MMMNNPDKRLLWRDALDDGEAPGFRAESLARTLLYARARRQRKTTAIAVAASAAVCLLLGGLAGRSSAPLASAPSLAAHRQSAGAAVPRPDTSPAPARTPVHFLTDEELFARFPGRPLALVGPPDHQRLIFLDEDSN